MTPLVGFTLTPSLAGDRLHVEPVFVATTLSVPILISTLSALALGVTVTRAFASSLATVGATGVVGLGALGIVTASLMSDVDLATLIFPP